MTTQYPPLQSLLAREASYLLDCIERKRPLLGSEAADLEHAMRSMHKAIAQEEQAFQQHVRECLARDEYEQATASVEAMFDCEIALDTVTAH